MTKIAVDGVRSVDLGVTDLAEAARFFTGAWGLAPVGQTASSVYLRGTDGAHHLVALHARPTGALLRLDLTAPSRVVVDGLYGRLREAGISKLEAPAAIAEPGGGYGFAFKDPEGRTIRILAEAAVHPDRAPQPDRPGRITHVVLNARDVKAAAEFYCRVLGFRVSDRTAMMTFLNCNGDHHSIAFAQSDHVTLNHIAFEMRDLESVMRGSGRMRDAGYAIEWGVGRHGPGNNVFAYFVGPEKAVVEYTAEVQQIDDSYAAHEPEHWKWPPGRIDQWGIANGPTATLKSAQTVLAFPVEIFHPAA